MTAFLVFADSDPILVMTSRAAAADGRLIEGLASIGLVKFIAHEVPLDGLREKYGMPFEVIESDVRNGRDFRVLDSKGSHVLANIRLADLGEHIRYDSQS